MKSWTWRFPGVRQVVLPVRVWWNVWGLGVSWVRGIDFQGLEWWFGPVRVVLDTFYEG